jgi:hypothetical protein
MTSIKGLEHTLKFDGSNNRINMKLTELEFQAFRVPYRNRMTL